MDYDKYIGIITAVFVIFACVGMIMMTALFVGLL